MIDYKKVGFKCGIELHQQLSGRKLFCHCSTDLKEEQQELEIQRKIRVHAGEQGKIDIAGAYEKSRDRTFCYHGYRGEFCPVDLDEEPPFMLGKEHLTMSLALAKLLHLSIPDYLFVMRKGVFDGSAITSFQRTMIVGLGNKDSFIKTSKGKVTIEQLNLEEDACKKEKEEGNVIHYSLSRLGIPLWELGTGADIQDPDHALEVAKYLGMVFRSFNLVKRGIGSIRQDVNVSIKDGARIEIKGWQDLHTLPKLIHNEVQRQLSLLDIKNELQKRGVKEIKHDIFDVTNDFSQTQFKVIFELIKNKGKVFAAKLQGFAGLLQKEVCEGKTFGKELAEYAMAYGTKGMIHSDEDLSKYHLQEEFQQLRTILQCQAQDLVFIIAEQESLAKAAVQAVLQRARYCLQGVPKETRVPNHVSATSSYARPLPGEHRMYPESDLPFITIDKQLLAAAEVPELLVEKAVRIEKEYRLPAVLAREVVDDERFFTFVKQFKQLEPAFIARVFIEIPKEITSRFHLPIEKIKDQHFALLFAKIANKEILPQAALEILTDVAKGHIVDFSAYKTVSEEKLVHEIQAIIEQEKDAPFSAVMGKIMEKYRGKIDGKKAAALIQKFMKH